MHSERYEISEPAAQAINAARASTRRVIAVGTTSLRALESAADGSRARVRPGARETALFITPGFRFRIVDLLLTNFHLPKSTLLMLVSAFAGIDRIRAAYAHAIRAAVPLLQLRRRNVARARTMSSRLRLLRVTVRRVRAELTLATR